MRNGRTRDGTGRGASGRAGGEKGGPLEVASSKALPPDSLRDPLSSARITNCKELLMNRCTSPGIRPAVAAFGVLSPPAPLTLHAKVRGRPRAFLRPCRIMVMSGDYCERRIEAARFRADRICNVKNDQSGILLNMSRFNISKYRPSVAA